MRIGDQYTCDCCGKQFVTGWSDEEAMDEFEDNFPGATKEGCMIVCTDCYKEIMHEDS